MLFIGEGPGADEDAQGIPFVGKAGQLLTQILTSVGIKRENVYITNIVKCRPPENRVPPTRRDDYLHSAPANTDNANKSGSYSAVG